MYRTALRASARTASKSATVCAAPRRFASTRLNVSPADGAKSWKSIVARWGLAAGGIWYYNTSDVFADSGVYSTARLPIAETEDENLPTVDAIAAARKSRQTSATASPASALSVPPSTAASPSTQAAAATSAVPIEGSVSDSPEALEEEASQEGAFNEETGEINWDCPCLGGMAHGPCGPEFREAFSCFVYSKDEPKGIDCIDKFKGMQDCFRQHPDVYGAELSDDEDDADLAAPMSADSSASSSEHHDDGFQSDPAKHPAEPFPVAQHHDPSHGDAVPSAAYSATAEETSVLARPGAQKGESEDAKRERAKAAKEQVKKDHGGKEEDRSQHRSESDLATGHEKGSKMKDDKEAGGKKGGW